MGLTLRWLGALALIGTVACTVSRGGLAPPDGGQDGRVGTADGASDTGLACGPGTCDDGIECTIDTCEGGQCRFEPDHSRCDGGAGGLCDPGAGDPVTGCIYEDCGGRTCVPPNQCMRARCEGEQCILESACGANEFCCGGECVPQGCQDGDPCTTGRCDVDLGCIQTPNEGAVCDDALFCNGMGICSAEADCVQQGNPCSAATVCDETPRRCVGCRVGHPEDCPGRSEGAWSDCAFTSTCAESGTRTRRVVTYECVNEVCEPDEDIETGTCTRDPTDGLMCGRTSCDPWSTCDYGGTCGETGSRERNCTYQRCRSGSCRSESGIETERCSDRATDGLTCDSTNCPDWETCGSFSSTCDTTGSQGRTCTDWTCGSGSCNDSNRRETQMCTRTTDGDACDDGTYCNGADECSGGTCSSHTGNPCTSPEDVCLENADNCVECSGSGDCSDPTPYCVGETCVECRNAGDCDDGDGCTTDSCDMGVCDHVGCGGVTSVCLNDSCVECEFDSQCSDPTPHCVSNDCVECETNMDCDNGDFCDGEETCSSSHTCQSGSDPCPTGHSCSEADGCEGTCTVASDCGPCLQSFCSSGCPSATETCQPTCSMGSDCDCECEST